MHSLEEDLKKALAHGGAQSTSASLPNQEDLYIPKVPPKYNLKGHKSNITFLAFHPQYTQLASASEDGTVKLW